MPITTVWEPRGFILEASGTVTFEDFLRANARFFEDARCETATYQILDMRPIDSLEITPTQVTTISVYDLGQSHSTPDVRVAIVVPDDRYDALIAVYDEVLHGSSWEVATFTDMAEARRWTTDPLSSAEDGRLADGKP